MTPVAYDIVIDPRALKALGKLDAPVRRRVAAAIDTLAQHPRPVGAKALVGHPGLLRLRVGDYRVVYTVVDQLILVTVVAVAHRREVYDRL